MHLIWHRRIYALLPALALLAALAACSGGDENSLTGTTGWGSESDYNQKYDPAELDKFKGYFQEIIEFTPDPTMAPGLGIIVRDRADDELVTVHLGPEDFIMDDLEAFGLVKGQKVKVTGVWARFGDKDVMIASKIKKGEFDQLKVRRTSDGLAYWNMSPETLQAERAEAFADVDGDEPGDY